MKKYICLLTLVFHGIFAQRPLQISLFNEATALPFTRFLTLPLHPGIQLGTEFSYNKNMYHRWRQTANVFYFYHNYLAQGMGLHTELAYEHRSKLGWALQGLIGLGYLHTFATQDEFAFQHGHYIKKKDFGNARLYPSFSVDLGYYFHAHEPYSAKIFIRYQSWVEYPYSPGFIPAMTHINLHLGYKFFITTKKNKHA